ncbi:Cysteine protease atg4b [Blyttiomyces sp. JEL0837]|nr:Cysteine protease atg4b [Blyttiomyces sp. JEL0837]
MAAYAAPENTFHDLSKRTSIFRNKLIEEFQLLDNISDNSNVQAPSHTSRDIAVRRKLTQFCNLVPLHRLRLNDSLQVFKRTQQAGDDDTKTDRRLTRTRNINSLPIGAWAGWVVRNPYFQNFLWLVIILNTTFVGVSAEIFLKWTDNFEEYWMDGWNVIDFAITVITAVPEVTDIMGTNDYDLLGPYGSVRTLRILRVLKVIARLSTLKIIIMTILNALQSMSYIMLLVVVVLYTYAVVGVFLYRPYTLAKDDTLHYHYFFSNIGTSLMTLFQLLTLDQWDEINREVAKYVDRVWSQLYIISWVWLGAFIFRNIFVGVMVNDFDKISESLKEEEAEYVKLRKFEKMRRKLNKELAVQGNIQRSITNLKAAAEGDPFADRSAETLNQDQKERKPSSASKGEQTEEGKKLSSCINSKDSDVLQSIQKLLVASHGISKGWEATVAETLTALAGTQSETMWPRDTLFKYLQVMENLQENMKEYEELQLLSKPNNSGAVESQQGISVSIWDQVKSSVRELINAASERFRQLREVSVSNNPVMFLSKKYTCLSDSEFFEDFHSRLWLTYRHGYPAIKPSSYTADIGWGCMLRSGQMLLANTLLIHSLGRDWRLKKTESRQSWDQYVKVISWFFDSNTSPYSIHRIALLGKQFDKEIGEWFGPSTISQVLKVLHDNNPDTSMSMYVAVDGVIFMEDVKTVCKITDANGKQRWNAVLILIPIRLGLDSLNSVYFEKLKACFDLPHCMGIAGGRPNSSLFFLGYEGNNLIYLDPHYMRPVVESKDTSSYVPEDLASYHCPDVRLASIESIDPSMVIGFYCRDEADLLNFTNSAKKLSEGKTPLFSIGSTAPDYTEAEVMSDTEDF